jgi:thermitase
MRHFNQFDGSLFWRLGIAIALILFAFPALSTAQSSQQYVPGRLLVKFRSDVPSVRVQSIINNTGARVTGEIPRIGVKILQLPRNASEMAAARAFGQHREVLFAEPDYIRPPAEVTPNDPRYPVWHLRKINAPNAWTYTTGSSGVIIAVLDTGVDGTHPDLSAKMIPGWNMYDNNSNTSDVTGHGTGVAGIAAASSNNGIGVASVAWGCRIMPVRVTTSSGMATDSMIANGLVWAADRGARIANLSFSSSNDSTTLTNAAAYFQSRGGLVIMAAGNTGTFSSAADNPYIIRVSATDANDVLASWSCTGNNIDVAAPGVGIQTTARGGGYSSTSGTSCSAPVVAGIAALLLSVNSSLSPSQVQDILKQSADDLGASGWDTQYGWGRVNAANAVQMAAGTSLPPDTTLPTVSFSSPANGSTLSGTVSVQISASDNRGVASVSFYVDGILYSTKTASPYTFSWNTTQAANGSHTLRAVATDTSGNSSTAQISVSVSNLSDTTPPVVSITSPSNGSTVSGSKVTINVSATDSGGISRVELYVDGALKATLTSAPYAFNQNPRNWTAGAHILQAKAYDRAGNMGVSTTITVYK